MDTEGKLFRVRRPDDGAVVPLTCTQAQFDKYWVPKGYTIAGDQPPSAKSQTPPRAKSEPITSEEADNAQASGGSEAQG